MISLNVSVLICILSIKVYRKEKSQGAVLLGGRIHPETLSKDMVIIANYDVENNEDKTVFIYEQGNTGLSALRN